MIKTIKGDLFKQDVECIVNPWNCNFIPWFLLWPHGVSGQLKRKAGLKIFNELLLKGPLKSGAAVLTSGGKLKNKKIIHVAGLTWYWTSNLDIVKLCVMNALKLCQENNIQSIAFPLIGTGVGGLKKEDVLLVMKQTAIEANLSIDIILVDYEHS